MRRGLISWSREEVAPEVLEQRVGRLQQAMRSQGWAAAIAYTSFARPAAVAWLTHFVPYWNEAILVVFPEGAPLLIAAFSKRVHSWIREVSHVGEIVGASDLGRATASVLQRLPSSVRVGVIELDTLPWSIVEPIIKSELGVELCDATAAFAAIRQPADEAEMRLARRAHAIAEEAIARIPAGVGRAGELLCAAEGSARLAGAEEVMIRLAPDLAAATVLRRMEGDVPLGERYAIELSVAYKAAWIRTTRSLSKGAPPAWWQQAKRWFADALSLLDAANVSAGPVGAAATAAPGKPGAWALEACIGSDPLSVIACGGSMPAASLPPRRSLPAGALAVLSLQIDAEEGAWLGAAPLVLAGSGKRSRLLG